MWKRLKKKISHILLSLNYGHSLTHLATVAMIKRRKITFTRYMVIYLDNLIKKRNRKKKLDKIIMMQLGLVIKTQMLKKYSGSIMIGKVFQL